MDNATGGEGEMQGELKSAHELGRLITFCIRNGVRAETLQEVERPANHLSGPAEDWFQQGPVLASNRWRYESQGK